MRRMVLRVTQAVAGVLLLGATSAQAQLELSVDDARTPELTGALPWTLSAIKVRLNDVPTADVTVHWTLVAGSATAPSDFLQDSGWLTFRVALLETILDIPVQIVPDSDSEWTPTLPQDEVFFVELDTPSNAVIAKGRGSVTLLDDDFPTLSQRPGVQFLSAVSGSVAPHGATNGQVKLQWRIPAAETQPNSVMIREDVGPTCSFPSSTGAGTLVVNTGTPPGAGMVQTYPHSGLALDTLHCYSVFAIYPAGATAEIAQIKATPFNAGGIAGGSIVWRFHSGSANVVPPTGGFEAIYTVDNQGTVHAMQRGTNGGSWPASWNPVGVGAPTQYRSPVVPLNGEPWLFLGTDGGGVHAVNGRSGRLIWSRSASFGGTQLPSGGGAQAAPAGLFKAFSGNNDMILVGTNNGGSNSFFALDPANGSNQGLPYSHAQMGSVAGMAVLDYPGNRAFFLTNASSATVYGVDLGSIGNPTLTGASGYPKNFNGSNGSAVLRNNRLIFGSGVDVVAVNIVDGTSYQAIISGGTDGPVKGFIWPDRRPPGEWLYFSTNTKVQGIRDTGSSFDTGPSRWFVSVSSPSMVLQMPGSNFIYVGDGGGRLVQINVVDQTTRQVTLEGPTVQIGAPSLDGPNNLVIVGSNTGTIHAVRVPIP